MAFSASLIADTVWGNKRVGLYLINTDSAEGTVNLGSKRIEHVMLSIKSGVASLITTHPVVGWNVGSTSTVSTGTLAMSAASAGRTYAAQIVFGEA